MTAEEDGKPQRTEQMGDIVEHSCMVGIREQCVGAGWFKRGLALGEDKRSWAYFLLLWLVLVKSHH